MRSAPKLVLYVLVALLISLPVLAQSRGGSGQASSEGAGRGSGVSSDSTSSIANRGIASSAPVVSTSQPTGSRDYGSGGSSYVASPGHSAVGGGGYVPDPQTTSFNSLGYYYQFQDFRYFLQSRYFMNGLYFSRFYRNREPLVTPELLKLTVRQPLKLSLQLLNSVDELEAMIKDREAGKPADRQAIAAKTQQIRDLAKKIRQDQSLSFFDQRRDKDTLKGAQVDNLGLEAIAQLREMATDLNTQLKNMYLQSQPSTVSVESLTAPSFESLTKGIDKLTKVIENSARRM